MLDDPFQSLDDTNREIVVRRLIRELLDDDVQVVVLTHDRATAKSLIDLYPQTDVQGVSLLAPGHGPLDIGPFHGSLDGHLLTILDGLEADDPSAIAGIASALRQLLEGFCFDYLRATGGEDLPMNRKNFGQYIVHLKKLARDLRPSPERMTTLDEWNDLLSSEGHFEGEAAPGMDQLRDITADALSARKQDGQLQPRGKKLSPVPRDPVLRDRVKTFLGGG